MEGPIHATTWIVGDFDDEAGLGLLKEALMGIVGTSPILYGHLD